MNEHLIIYHDNFKELQTISRNMDNNRNFQFYKLSDAESDLIYKSILVLFVEEENSKSFVKSELASPD